MREGRQVRVYAGKKCGQADDTLRLFSEWVQWLRARELDRDRGRGSEKGGGMARNPLLLDVWALGEDEGGEYFAECYPMQPGHHRMPEGRSGEPARFAEVPN